VVRGCTCAKEPRAEHKARGGGRPRRTRRQFLPDEETGFLMKREIQNFEEQDLPYKLKQEQDTAAKKIKNVKVERLIGEIKRNPT